MELESRLETKVFGHPPEYGLDVEVAVRDVRGDDPTVVELQLIRPQRFPSQEVTRNGVGTEGIKNDHVVSILRLLEHDATVADHEVDRSRSS